MNKKPITKNKALRTGLREKMVIAAAVTSIAANAKNSKSGKF